MNRQISTRACKFRPPWEPLRILRASAGMRKMYNFVHLSQVFCRSPLLRTSWLTQATKHVKISRKLLNSDQSQPQIEPSSLKIFLRSSESAPEIENCFQLGALGARCGSFIMGLGSIITGPGSIITGPGSLRTGLGSIWPGLGSIRPGLGSVRPGLGSIRPGLGSMRPGLGSIRPRGVVRTASGAPCTPSFDSLSSHTPMTPEGSVDYSSIV